MLLSLAAHTWVTGEPEALAGWPELPAVQGLTGADRGTVVKVINTSEILKQHKPHY